MNYREAIFKSRLNRILGIVLGFFVFASLAISLLKFLYFGFDDGTSLGKAIAVPLQKAISWLYEHTQFLSLFWEYSPIPNHKALTDMNNFYFLLTYLAIFVAMAFKASGDKLAIRLARIREDIENQIIKESIDGKTTRSKQEIEKSIVVPNASIFKQIQQLYVAPIVTAVIAGVLLKFSGF